MNDRKELFWDEEKQQQYWTEWIETGNNDIPIKHYIGTNKSGQIEPLVMPKIAEVEAKCKEEITWIDGCFEEMAKGVEYAEADKPYLEGMRNVAVKIMKIIDSNFSE